MSHKIQLDLFEDENEVSVIRKELKELSQQQDKWKQSLLKRYQDLSKFCLNLQQENEQLKNRLDYLENKLPKDTYSTNDDLLERLFKEAYTHSSLQ